MLIIFDLDGTILNTLEDLAATGNHVLAAHGYPVHPTDAYRYFVGNGIRKLVERALPETARTEKEIDCIFKEFLDYYAVHKMDLTRPYPTIPETLSQLQARGHSLAVATNKAHEAVAPLMAHYFPNIRFAAAIGNKPGIPTKPAPDIVYDILTRTGFDTSNTLYVGDTAVDMETAQRAGLRKIGVLWGFRDREELASADFIIEKPEEILDIVDR